MTRGSAGLEVTARVGQGLHRGEEDPVGAPTGPRDAAPDPEAEPRPPTAAPPGPPGPERAGAGFLRELPILFVVAAAIAFLLKTFVAQAFYIPSGSMIPQLEVHDRVVVSKISYRLHEPRRGDLVVFDAPLQAARPAADPSPNPVVRAVRGFGEAVGMVQPSTEEFVKRVIALPGETVEARAGRLYVDGRLLLEPYLPEGSVTGDFAPVGVPADHLWVMGDSRANSADSRVFGPIATDSVVGRAVLKVWPPARASFL